MHFLQPGKRLMLLLVAGVTALTLGLASCGGTVSGSQAPASSGSSSSPSSAPSTSGSSGGGGGGWG